MKLCHDAVEGGNRRSSAVIEQEKRRDRGRVVWVEFGQRDPSHFLPPARGRGPAHGADGHGSVVAGVMQGTVIRFTMRSVFVLIMGNAQSVVIARLSLDLRSAA